LWSAQFTAGFSPGLNSGYSVVGMGPAGQDDTRWIGAICCDLGRDELSWTVLNTRGQAVLPRNIDDAMVLSDFPLDETWDRDDTSEPSAPPPYWW
jgi:hypothetical protein